ncbi:MAG TPA: chemotaxis protein CheB [Polyangiaceae bacterium]
MDGNARTRLVVMGASAGAIETLSALLPELPPDFSAPLVIVVHLPQGRPSMLAGLFSIRCRLAVTEAEDKERLDPGVVYFAPPGYHVLVERDASLSLDCDEPVNFSRPSIDVLFQSAAMAFGPRVAAVLLTGASRDGAEGLAVVKSTGGITIVQTPESAPSDVMPRAGIAAANPDYVLPPREIAELLSRLVPSQP